LAWWWAECRAAWLWLALLRHAVYRLEPRGPNEEQRRNALDLARWRRPHVITGLDEPTAGMACVPPSRYC